MSPRRQRRCFVRAAPISDDILGARSVSVAKCGDNHRRDSDDEWEGTRSMHCSRVQHPGSAAYRVSISRWFPDPSTRKLLNSFVIVSFEADATTFDLQHGNQRLVPERCRRSNAVSSHSPALRRRIKVGAAAEPPAECNVSCRIAIHIFGIRAQLGPCVNLVGSQTCTCTDLLFHLQT